MMTLQDRVTIVTGAAQGLGLAIARRFVEEGARVLLADLNAGALAGVAQQLGQPSVVVDVAQRADVQRMVAYATERMGPVDVLVNNAGVFRSASLLELSEDDFDLTLAVNLKSVLFGIQAVAPQMIERRRGSIVNVASVAAVLGSPGAAAYCASKAAVAQLTNVAAIELAPHNVRVNALGPGTFATEMAQDAYADESLRNRILPRTPLGRMGRPEEAAGVVLFLAGDDSSYMTGKTLYADGGRIGLNLTM
jgi:glucose 1-dehydrogenase